VAPQKFDSAQDGIQDSGHWNPAVSPSPRALHSPEIWRLAVGRAACKIYPKRYHSTLLVLLRCVRDGRLPATGAVPSPPNINRAQNRRISSLWESLFILQRQRQRSPIPDSQSFMRGDHTYSIAYASFVGAYYIDSAFVHDGR